MSVAVHRPEKETDKLAVLCPGFLDSKDYRHLVMLAEMLSERGYVAVRLDPTGTWESSGEIADYNTTQYLEDIKTVIDYMNTDSKYTHILLGGHSRGGRMSVLYAARDPKISLVLGIMPSSSPIEVEKREEWKRTGIKISKRDLPDDPENYREFHLPFSHALDLDKYDTLSEAAKIKVPVILITGELDEVVLPEEVQILFNAIGGKKKFVNIPNIGHDYRRKEEEIKVVNGIISEQINAIEI